MEADGPPVIVVDTNIICYRFMAGAFTELADAAWRRDSHWIAPLLWRSEFRNVLTGAIRNRAITLDIAIEIAGTAETMMAGNEFLNSPQTVLRVAAESRCSAYDCEFVALAFEERVRLLTHDRQILRDFPRLAVSLEQFVRR